METMVEFFLEHENVKRYQENIDNAMVSGLHLYFILKYQELMAYVRR
jgi:hypothetical protein